MLFKLPAHYHRTQLIRPLPAEASLPV